MVVHSKWTFKRSGGCTSLTVSVFFSTYKSYRDQRGYAVLCMIQRGHSAIFLRIKPSVICTRMFVLQYL